MKPYMVDRQHLLITGLTGVAGVAAMQGKKIDGPIDYNSSWSADLRHVI